MSHAVQRFARWRGHQVVALGGRGLLAVVFLWASFHKILHPEQFALDIATYQVLPLSLINLLAIGLPWVEAIVGLLLVGGLWTRESALVTVGMNLMFVVAIVLALDRGEQIMCGCFASAEAGHQIGWDLVLRDLGLMLVGAYLVALEPGWLSIDRLLARRRRSPDAATT